MADPIAAPDPGVPTLTSRAQGLAAEGRLAEAIGVWDELIAANPGDAGALHEKGLLLHRQGSTDEAIVHLAHAVLAAPADPVFANNLAVLLSDAGRRDEALVQFERALALNPGNIHIGHQIRRLRSELVPFWHVPMLNDQRRNDAFEEAIKAVLAQVGEDALVLDIGTGSGLLSLMAARAGARQVVACEIVPVIARTAQAIVAANGYDERIHIVPKPSSALEVGVDMPARANVLVSEILSSDLLTEKVLDSFEDAYRRLLTPDAVVIPRAATAVGCLVASETLADYAYVSQVSGFDVSLFNPLGPLKLPIHGTMTEWQRLSDDVNLVHVDLTLREQGSDLQHVPIPVTRDGIAVGIVQWMHVELAEGIVFDNHPDGYSDGGWLQVLHRFPRPVEVKAGQVLDLAAGHDRTTLILVPFGPGGAME